MPIILNTISGYVIFTVLKITYVSAEWKSNRNYGRIVRYW